MTFGARRDPVPLRDQRAEFARATCLLEVTPHAEALPARGYFKASIGCVDHIFTYAATEHSLALAWAAVRAIVSSSPHAHLSRFGSVVAIGPWVGIARIGCTDDKN